MAESDINNSRAEEQERVRKLDNLRFDPDCLPTNPHNVEVAQRLGLWYDSKSRVYRDSEGYMIRDKFGQPL
jgi:hypothetical protein